jgi:hypothetical protein
MSGHVLWFPQESPHSSHTLVHRQKPNLSQFLPNLPRFAFRQRRPTPSWSSAARAEDYAGIGRLCLEGVPTHLGTCPSRHSNMSATPQSFESAVPAAYIPIREEAARRRRHAVLNHLDESGRDKRCVTLSVGIDDRRIRPRNGDSGYRFSIRIGLMAPWAGRCSGKTVDTSGRFGNQTAWQRFRAVNAEELFPLNRNVVCDDALIELATWLVGSSSAIARCWPSTIQAVFLRPGAGTNFDLLSSL